MRFDVHPLAFNRELARELKERKIIQPPAWTGFVKSGVHKERPPQHPDWFYHRAASVLRTVAVRGPVGTAKLSVIYGGRKNRGVKPDQFRAASTNIIRKCLQQLEKAGLLKQAEHAGHKGRILTKDGSAFVKTALERVRKA